MSIRPELEQTSGTSIEGFYAVDSEVRVQPGLWSTSPDSVTYVWRVAGKEVGRGVTHTPTGVAHRAPLVLDAYAYAAGRAIGHDRIDLGRPAPATPTGLHLVGRSATTAAFEWDPVESDEIVEATVKRGSGLVNQTLLRGHAFTLTEGLAPNTAYTVGIRRLSDGGSPSSLSTSIAFTTGPMGAPTAVKAARKTTSSVTLQWKRPAGAHIYRIVYWRGSDRKVVTTIIQAFQHKVTKLKRNSTYSFYVEAVSRDGRSVTKSATVKVKTAK